VEPNETARASPPEPLDVGGPDPRRWGILAVVIVAQLMIVLDASIVTIALPSAQHALNISTANRQWVVTAYTLAFGGFLLLGGRIADFSGRKRMFVVGLLGFAGVLTEYASWRWCLLVNVPIAVLASTAAVLVVRESRASGSTRYDVPGALLSTLGLVSLVYGFTKAESDGWSATVTIVLLVVAVILLTAFAYQETKASHPLLPLRVVRDRNRGGAFLASLLTSAGLLAMFVFVRGAISWTYLH
jgi:MFS family permease